LSFCSPSDREAIVALINAVELEPITVGMLHERDQRTPGSERWRVAEDEAARIVGISESAREPWMTADEAWLWIAVDPSARARNRLGPQAVGDPVRAHNRRAAHPYEQRFGECARVGAQSEAWLPVGAWALSPRSDQRVMRAAFITLPGQRTGAPNI